VNQGGVGVGIIVAQAPGLRGISQIWSQDTRRTGGIAFGTWLHGGSIQGRQLLQHQRLHSYTSPRTGVRRAGSRQRRRLGWRQFNRFPYARPRSFLPVPPELKASFLPQSHTLPQGLRLRTRLSSQWRRHSSSTLLYRASTSCQPGCQGLGQERTVYADPQFRDPRGFFQRHDGDDATHDFHGMREAASI